MNFITACHFYQKNGTWKSRKVVTNLYYKNEYVAHIRNSKPTLIYGLILKRVHRVIKFNQKVWLWTIYQNEHRPNKNSKKWFWEKFFQVNQ